MLPCKYVDEERACPSDMGQQTKGDVLSIISGHQLQPLTQNMQEICVRKCIWWGDEIIGIQCMVLEADILEMGLSTSNSIFNYKSVLDSYLAIVHYDQYGEEVNQYYHGLVMGKAPGHDVHH